jgi:two-component system nitrate/nitrite response regulator NarL
MDPVSVFLVDRDQLFREGMKRLLAGTIFSVCGETKDLNDVQDRLAGKPAPDLLVIDLTEGRQDQLPRLRCFRERLSSRIVVLTSDICFDRFREMVAIGVHGYITKDISRDALIQALQLVLLGEELFPTRLIARVTERLASAEGLLSVDRQQHNRSALPELSERERRVLGSLTDGQSNKAIARTLKISEASVKLHIKDLLRKLHVQNRTQVAIWAYANGYVAEEWCGHHAGSLHSSMPSSAPRGVSPGAIYRAQPDEKRGESGRTLPAGE